MYNIQYYYHNIIVYIFYHIIYNNIMPCTRTITGIVHSAQSSTTILLRTHALVCSKTNRKEQFSFQSRAHLRSALHVTRRLAEMRRSGAPSPRRPAVRQAPREL
uniref:Uncharacterized protein n=1 Tax=Schizaphis graminum TaxID=13262 RepID=A0A2S2NVG4_SCHGA